jgi:hypothetical protein
VSFSIVVAVAGLGGRLPEVGEKWVVGKKCSSSLFPPMAYERASAVRCQNASATRQ